MHGTLNCCLQATGSFESCRHQCLTTTSTFTCCLGLLGLWRLFTYKGSVSSLFSV